MTDMPEYTIVDHHLDENVDPPVYRMTVAEVINISVPVIGEDGLEVRMPGEPVMDQQVALRKDGTPRESKGETVFEDVPVLDPDTGEPLYHAGEVMMEQKEVSGAILDFIFAADDERWSGKKTEEIATAQAKLVLDSLNERHAEEHEEIPMTPMPTIGQRLGDV
jgi:hypothetical protein